MAYQVANLPLLSLIHHLGPLHIDPDSIEFVSSIGIGDLAVVERGRWHRPDGWVSNVVIKGYKPFVVGSPADFRELLLEASKLHRLRHPYITRFLGLGCFSHGTLAEVRESIFMVEEYVGTRNLRKLIGEQMRCRLKNLYDMQTALRWACQVASALASLHEQQPAYIHGDVKADNVFLTDCLDLSMTHAKLGDLKPHRHVYDREPSTLSHHQQQQQQQVSKQARQSSLARYTLERSSCSSSVQSWTSAGSNSNAADLRGVWLGKQQQQDMEESDQQLSRKDSSGAASWDETVKDASAADDDVSCGIGRAQSAPVPIAARGVRLDGVGSCPVVWDPAEVLDGSMDAACCATSPSSSRSSLSGAAAAGRGAAGGATCCSLPITSCLSASEMAEKQEAVAAAKAAAASAAAAVGEEEQQQAAVDLAEPALAASVAGAGESTGFRRRSGRTVCLSDSASSTNGSGSGSSSNMCMGLKASIELDSLAAADDDDDDADGVNQVLQQVAAAEQEQAGRCCVPGVCQGQQGQQVLKGSLQTGWDDCSAHGYDRQSKSLPSEQEELVFHAVQQQQQQHEQLLTSLSGPSDVFGVVRDAKVHHGQLMPLSGLLVQHEQPCKQQGKQVSLQVQQQLERQLAAAGPDKQQGQQEACFGWELSPSGAASPCGAVHSAMLDLFADMAEEEVVLSRRFRDIPCQYTLTPGSMQQRLLPPSLLPAAQPGLKGSQSWDPAFTSSIASALASGTNSNCLPSLASCPQQQQQQLERTGSLKAGAPSAIESKQHGSNSAFAALTAIDCIREETSSIATDSVMGSCPASRESTAHGGVHYYRDTGHLASIQDQDDSSQVLSKPSPKAGGFMSGLPRALSTLRSLGSSLGSSGSIVSDGGPKDEIGALGSSAANDSSGSSSGSSSSGGFGAARAATGSSGWIEQLDGVLGCEPLSPSAAVAALDAAARADSLGAASGGGELGGSAFLSHMLPGSGSGSDGQQELEEGAAPSSPAAAAACAAAAAGAGAGAGQAKRVRFSVERPAGATPSRDYSLLYAAPELLSGQRPTEKVDVFAFGVTLYELLSRSLLISHCAAAVGHNRSRRSGRHGSKHSNTEGSRRGKPTGGYSPYNSAAGDAAEAGGSSDSDSALPEQQLLLAYAQMVASGYRPPFPAHFPEAVQALISSCWAAEPHERPRMAEVLAQLQAWSMDKHVVGSLDSYLAGLADIGYGAGGAAGPSFCGCVIS